MAVLLIAVQAHARDTQASWFADGDRGDAATSPELWNSPEWVLNVVQEKQFQHKYRFITRLNPYYLRGDFNGDGRPDFAVLIERLADKKQGIAIFHYGEKTIRVIGAGKVFGNGDDDFAWMDAWQVYPKGKVEQGVEEAPPPKLLGEALLVEKSESASTLIHWNGKRYVWYQQGD